MEVLEDHNFGLLKRPQGATARGASRASFALYGTKKPVRGTNKPVSMRVVSFVSLYARSNFIIYTGGGAGRSARGPQLRASQEAPPPTPGTPHPACCTLHPAPYNLHPAPCTLHPASHTLHLTPYTSYPAPYRVQGARDGTWRVEGKFPQERVKIEVLWGRQTVVAGERLVDLMWKGEGLAVLM